MGRQRTPSSDRHAGWNYPTVENAYQAAKTLNLVQRKKFRACTATVAKKEGRLLDLRKDWEHVKLAVMEALLFVKFEDKELRTKLLATGSAPLIEGNWWGDRYWGVCDGVGENHLGRLLMKVRDEIRGKTTSTP